MTTLGANNGEGGTNGTGVTTGNSGGSSGTPWTAATPASGGSIDYSTAQSAHGSLSIELKTGASGGQDTLQWGSAVLSSAPTTLWYRVYVYLPTLPASSIKLFKAIAGPNQAHSVSVNSSGKITALASGSTTVWTSSATAPTGKWFRIEGSVLSSATAGQVKVQVFTTNMDNTLPDDSFTSTTTLNTAGGAITAVQFGALISVINLDCYIDDLAISDSAPLGAAGTPPPPSALVVTNGAEAGVTGTAVTAAGSGGGPDTAFTTVTTGGTFNFSNAHFAHGSLSYLCETGASAATNVAAWGSGVLSTSPASLYGRVSVYLPSAPGNLVQMCKFIAGATQVGRVVINTSAEVELIDSGGTVRYTSSTSLELGVWNRIEFHMVSSASVGVLQLRLYTAGVDNISPDEDSGPITGLNTAGGAVTTVQVGILAPVANVVIFYDDLALDDTTWNGPAGTNPPNPTAPISLSNDAEGRTNGTAITVGNSGAGLDNAFTEVTKSGSATATFSSTEAMHGSFSFKFATVSGSQDTFVEWDSSVLTSADTTFYTRAYVFLPNYPGSELTVIAASSSGTQIGAVSISTTGHVLSRDTSATVIMTSTTVLPLNAWCRLECLMTSDAVAGQIEIKIYTSNPDNILFDEIMSSPSTQNTDGGPATAVEFGVVFPASGVVLYLDDIGYSGTGYLGNSGNAIYVPSGWGVPIQAFGASTGGGGTVQFPFSNIAIPGKVMLGCYEGGDLLSSQQAMEAAIGRALPIHKFYCDASTTHAGRPDLNTLGAAAAASLGFLHIQFALAVWSGGTLATVAAQPAGPVNKTHPWFGYDDVLAGGLDAVIDQWAMAIKSLPTTCIVDIGAEPDQTARIAEPKTNPNNYGPMLLYAKARFDALGVTNAEWSWTVSGFQAEIDYQELYDVQTNGTSPLDAAMTWIMWDPYIDGPGNLSPTKFTNFAAQIQAGMLTNLAKTKYLGLSEWGVGNGGEARAPIFAACAAVFQGAGLDLVEYWDSSTGTGYKNYDVFGSADQTGFNVMANNLVIMA